MTLIALFTVTALLAGQTTTSAQRSASDLTRDLNSGPPIGVPAQTPAQAPAQAARPAQAPTSRLPPIGGSQPLTPGGSSPAPASAPPPAAGLPSSGSSRPAHADTSPSARRPASGLPPIGAAGSAAPAGPPPAVSPSAAPPPAAPPSAASPAARTPNAALGATAIAALPFTVDLSGGLSLTEGRPGPDFDVYSVKRGGKTLAMIYAGPASQFPIYDGQMIQAGGRTSIVITEDGRRLALEHLFQRQTAPREVHVWIASVEGEDRILAERVGQSVDIR